MTLQTEKTKKLMNLLDTLDFNQIVIFVKTSHRAKELSRILESDGFHNICITGDMPTDMRLDNFKKFKQFEVRILISTGLFGRGIDVERVNVVINYDFPDKADEYLHRVGRAGRFGTKGLAISFISSPENAQIMEQVQLKFAVDVPSLPDTIDSSLYMNWRVC
jgi:ATP-dependent RNA helicase uap56